MWKERQGTPLSAAAPCSRSRAARRALAARSVAAGMDAHYPIQYAATGGQDEQKDDAAWLKGPEEPVKAEDRFSNPILTTMQRANVSPAMQRLFSLLHTAKALRVPFEIPEAHLKQVKDEGTAWHEERLAKRRRQAQGVVVPPEQEVLELRAARARAEAQIEQLRSQNEVIQREVAVLKQRLDEEAGIAAAAAAQTAAESDGSAKGAADAGPSALETLIDVLAQLRDQARRKVEAAKSTRDLIIRFGSKSGEDARISYDADTHTYSNVVNCVVHTVSNLMTKHDYTIFFALFAAPRAEIEGVQDEGVGLSLIHDTFFAQLSDTTILPPCYAPNKRQRPVLDVHMDDALYRAVEAAGVGRDDLRNRKLYAPCGNSECRLPVEDEHLLFHFGAALSDEYGSATYLLNAIRNGRRKLGDDFEDILYAYDTFVAAGFLAALSLVHGLCLPQVLLPLPVFLQVIADSPKLAVDKLSGEQVLRELRRLGFDQDVRPLYEGHGYPAVGGGEEDVQRAFLEHHVLGKRKIAATAMRRGFERAGFPLMPLLSTLKAVGADLELFLYGKSINATEVVGRLQAYDCPPRTFEKLREVLQRLPQELLKDFVHYCTGRYALSARDGQEIRIIEHGSDTFKAEVCFNHIHIPAAMPVEEMRVTLENTLLAHRGGNMPLQD